MVDPFDSLLAETCDVLLPSRGQPDDYGNAPPAFDTLDAGVPCRVSYAKARPHELQAVAKYSTDHVTVFMRPWAKGRLTEAHWLALPDGRRLNITQVLYLKDGSGAEHHIEATALVVKP